MRTSKSNTSSPLSEPVRPLAQTNGHDPRRLVDELVPCLSLIGADLDEGALHNQYAAIRRADHECAP